MRLRYGFRPHPTPGQRDAPARAFGCARTVFDDGLRAREEARAEGRYFVSFVVLSTDLIRENQAVAVEDLAVTGCGAQVRPVLVPARRPIAGTRRDSSMRVAGIRSL
uniref:helix-turn-helix domain-containing protein n=1 Tax=Herbidospora sakaeratensis TaxID=564415 RepID=UPI0034E223E3